MGSLRVRIASLWAAARGRYYPHGTRRRRGYRETAQVLFGACVVVPLLAVGWIVLATPPAASAAVLVAASLLLPFGAVVAFVLLDRWAPGRAPGWKALGAVLLSAPAAAYGLVALLAGRGRPALAAGSVLWAEVPNDEDQGRSSKVRPVVVVADQGATVVVRWFTSQDKSRRHDYVEFTPAQQRECGLEGLDGSTWLSTQARPLPRAALREPVGRVPAGLLQRRPR